METAEASECWAYWQAFGARAKEAQETGDEQAQSVFILLNAATSLHLKEPNNATSPFCPMFTSPEGRTADVDDFTDEHLEVFSQLIERIEDPELRARIADIVWVRKPVYWVAEQAVSAYLESARRLEYTERPWPPCIERIKRAVTLSVLHGKNTQMYKQAIAHIKDTLNRHGDNDPSYLSADLMEILLIQKEGDSTEYAQLSEKHALSAQNDQDWYRPKTYWKLQARWLERANDCTSSRAARIREAEQTVQAARDLANRARPDYLTAAEVLKDAIQAFKHIGSEHERVEKLHQELLEYQLKSTSQMGRVSTEIPIDDLSASATNAVMGKTRREAICALALIDDPSYLGFLRQHLEQDKQQNPFFYAIPWSNVDASGRTTDFVPSSFSDSVDERESATRSHLLRNAGYMRSLMVQARIEPARLQILQEHNVHEQDFAPFTTNNPFVPEGREAIFARGLHAGLQGDFVVAIPLLTPQLENSIRHVLTQHGVVTSKLNSKGIQDFYSLGKILHLPEMIEILGEDITFDLQGLLIERSGANLRNEMAHGLMDSKDFFRTHAVYLWWLTLHLLCRIALVRDSQTE